MGWDFVHATHYKADGKIDKKAEIESNFDDNFVVLKSSMMGSVYYAAIQNTKGEVFAVVVLTKVDNSDWFNFGMKIMDETQGPCYYDCPVSILKLLTETTFEYAQEWRKKCREKAASKKNPDSLSNLPIGSKIRFMWGGKIMELIKREPAYQFKTTWWWNPESNTYFHKKNFPHDYIVVR